MGPGVAPEARLFCQPKKVLLPSRRGLVLRIHGVIPGNQDIREKDQGSQGLGRTKVSKGYSGVLGICQFLSAIHQRLQQDCGTAYLYAKNNDG